MDFGGVLAFGGATHLRTPFHGRAFVDGDLRDHGMNETHRCTALDAGNRVVPARAVEDSRIMRG